MRRRIRDSSNTICYKSYQTDLHQTYNTGAFRDRGEHFGFAGQIVTVPVTVKNSILRAEAYSI